MIQRIKRNKSRIILFVYYVESSIFSLNQSITLLVNFIVNGSLDFNLNENRVNLTRWLEKRKYRLLDSFRSVE